MNDYRNVLLVSEAYIRSQTDADDNITGKLLLPAIKLSQDVELTEALGDRLVDALKFKVSDGSIDESGNTMYKILLDDYIQDFLSYQTLANLVFLGGTKTANIGTVETTDTNIINTVKANRDLQKEGYLHYARHYLKRMQAWVKAHRDAFPELEECHNCDGQMASHLNSASNTPLWLGGFRSRKIVGVPEL
jgi:hypothetical protein